MKVRKKSIKVFATQDIIWNILTNFNKYGDWMYDVVYSRVIGDQTNGVGTRYRINDEDEEYPAEVTHWQENELLISEFVGGIDIPLVKTQTHEWLLESNSLDKEMGKTEVTFVSRYRLKGGIFGLIFDLLFLRWIINYVPNKYLQNIEYYAGAAKYRNIDRQGKGG